MEKDGTSQERASIWTAGFIPPQRGGFQMEIPLALVAHHACPADAFTRYRRERARARGETEAGV